MQITLVIFY